MESSPHGTFINKHTRAVVVSFTIYNANFNTFSVVRYLVEWGASGFIVPSSSYEGAVIIQDGSAKTSAILVCGMVTNLFIVAFYSWCVLCWLRISAGVLRVPLCLLLPHLVHPAPPSSGPGAGSFFMQFYNLVPLRLVVMFIGVMSA